MLVDEKIEQLQNVTKSKITYADIANILGVTRSAIQNRILRKSPLKSFEEQLIDDYYKDHIKNDSYKPSDIMPITTIINIPYWEELPEDLKTFDIPVTIPISLIKNHWYLNPDNLFIVPMVGDKMTNYWYRINENDILIIDTTHNFIRGNGVYFATSQNNTRFWIREMQALINDDIQIRSFAPSGEVTKIFTPDQLEAVDFRIIGKVIKNVSFRL